MIFQKSFWMSSAQKLKSVKYLALIASFIAMKIAISTLYVPVSENLRIGFGYLLVSIEAALIGPVAGIVSGAVTDLVGFFLFPSGSFFPGYTLTAMLASLIWSLFLYNQQITLWKIITAKALNSYLINVLLGSLWSAMLYGNAYIVYFTKSLIKNTLLFPIEVLLILALFRLLIPFLTKKHYLIPQNSKFLQKRK